MKNLAFFLAWLSLPSSLFAQSTPMFETTIRVKDAIGNQDSVVIGYDLDDIPFDTAQFHEILDNSPFDSTFGVRVVQRSWEMIYHYPHEGDAYKRLITDAETAVNAPWCTLGGSSILLIHAKHQPITLYWDRAAFDPAYCQENAYFSPDKTPHLIEPSDWIDSGGPIIFSCAAKADSMVYTLNPNWSWDGDLNHSPFWPLFSMREIEGIGVDTVVGIGLEFVFGNYYSPCRLVSDTETPMSLPDFGFKVQPNPSNGVFKVRNERGVSVQRVRLFDSLGRLVWEQAAPLGGQDEFLECQANGLSPGLYYAVLTWRDGYESVRKLVKM